MSRSSRRVAFVLSAVLLAAGVVVVWSLLVTGMRATLHGFGFDPELIWVTVFEGDERLGLGPDSESIEIWRSLGVPDERIVRLPAAENFWQAGPTGPCGPCSEMYIDRGLEFGPDDARPGDDTDRYLEYWNHVFMAHELHEDGSLSELPRRNIDTGLGLERMAVIQQGADSVFDTDAFAVTRHFKFKAQTIGSPPTMALEMIGPMPGTLRMSSMVNDVPNWIAGST